MGFFIIYKTANLWAFVKYEIGFTTVDFTNNVIKFICMYTTWVRFKPACYLPYKVVHLLECDWKTY